MLYALSCGVVAFPGLFLFFREVTSRTFKQWTDADVVLVSERLVSILHAVLATTAGVIIITSCSNVMTDRHWLATAFVWFGIPYMSYDIYAMYLSHYYTYRVKGHQDYKEHSLRTLNAFLRQDFLLVLHHVVLLTIFLPITLFLRRDLGDFFIGCLFTAEFSTPFISVGRILIQLGLKDCWLHKLNGVVVLLAFFTCRIALFPTCTGHMDSTQASQSTVYPSICPCAATWVTSASWRLSCTGLCCCVERLPGSTVARAGRSIPPPSKVQRENS
ncbi:hypothetical protein AAFF_G00277260 [Aldrovandia affinis]|uniref:TLC domain-containing protein n=1 Tax=Aldrovandia affinis TaxID=143900 RepID=A0AAD7W222_9TELE|nr:hypothetical protein AAFF_G00277260 [Aldrovandia affinis]